MSSKANSVERTFHGIGNDVKDRITDIASKVKAEASDATEAVHKALHEQRECAADALNKAGRKARRLSRRYPIQIFAGALALGFLIGRIRR